MSSSAAKSVILLLLAGGGIVAWFVIGVAAVFGLFPLVLAALFLAWGGIFAWYVPPVWRDASQGLVGTVEGFITPAERQTNIPFGYFSLPILSYYWVVDGGQRFWIPGNAYPILTPARHRLYFLPTSRRVVAVEPIS